MKLLFDILITTIFFNNKITFQCFSYIIKFNYSFEHTMNKNSMSYFFINLIFIHTTI
jgi:hypothetical protein